LCHLKLLKNVIIRKIVNTLLGKNLVIELTEVPDKRMIEIIDLRRRLPYGKWSIKSEDKRTFTDQGVKSVVSLTIEKE
jgi:hypothetical protein